MSINNFMDFSRSINSPTECLNKIVNECTEYLKIAEQEKTKRREIEQWERESLAKIKAQRDLLMKYLDRSFDERSENFRSLFCVVDQALISGNNEQLAMALNTMTEIAKSNPFKELSNLALVRTALNDSKHEWKF
jgi:ribonucleotide reductase alpha subunit